MALHAEVPLISFLGLMHFWIASCFSFSSRKVQHNRGVNYRTASTSILARPSTRLSHQTLIAQMVLFQQMTEVQYRVSSGTVHIPDHATNHASKPNRRALFTPGQTSNQCCKNKCEA